MNDDYSHHLAEVQPLIAKLNEFLANRQWGVAWFTAQKIQDRIEKVKWIANREMK
jgi:hypothetical protein